MTSTTIHSTGWASRTATNSEHQNAGSVFSHKLLEYWNDFRKWRHKRSQQRIDRDAFLNLLRVSDRELTDMGITRDDVRRAANLPLEINAAAEIEALRLKNRIQW